MKVNLECGPDLRNGYVNVVSGVSQLDAHHEGMEVVNGRFTNLDPLFANESIEEMVFNPVINIIDIRSLPQILKHWWLKMQPNGVIKLKAINVREVCRAGYSGEINLKDIHSLTLGLNGELNSVFDVEEIKRYFNNQFYNLVSINVNGIGIEFEIQKRSQ